jgi:hypothetical protein
MALRVATLVAAGAAGVVAVAPATADAARLTHTVTIEGELVNHWSIAEPGPCGTVGDGTVTVKFKTTRRTKVLPYIDPFARALGGGYRAWIVAEPLGPGRRLFTDMGYVKATGTVTRVDNTVSRPPDPQDTEPCPPIEKDACGTVPLGSARGTKAAIGRFDRRRITVNAIGNFYPRRGSCGYGQLEFWADHRFVGRAAEGWLPLKMPSARALKRRGVVKAKGSSHKRTTFADPGDETTTDDVTRRATVTFRRR